MQNLSALHWLTRCGAAFKRRITSAEQGDIVRFALFIFACLPVFLALRMQQTYWVNIPIWDEWDTPGLTLLHLAQNKLSWADLIAQHNESRKFFPRLIYIVLSWPQGWHVRHGMVLAFLCACLLSVFLLLRLRDGAKRISGAALFAWLVSNALLFGPWQYKNFLCGYSFEFFIPILALCGCVAVNRAERPLGAKVLWNSALAVLATYSFAHGMILWALALPIPTADERRRADWFRKWSLWLLAYGLIGLLAVCYYFVGYKRPDIAPASAGLLQAPLLGRFLLAWLGDFLRTDSVSPERAGGLALIVLGAAGMLSVLFVWRNKQFWTRYYPWFVLAAFSLGSGILTAIGRANLGLEAVFSPTLHGFGGYRYNSISVLAYIAAVGLLFRLYRDWIGVWIESHQIWRLPFVIIITVFATLLSEGWLSHFTAQRDGLSAFKDNRRRARTALVWSQALPQNPDLYFVYPVPETFPPRIMEMKKAGLITVPEISERVREAIKRIPPTGKSDAGAIESSKVEKADKLRLAGWARSAARNSRADYVVLGWEDEDRSFHPFTALSTIGEHRPDLINEYGAIGWRHDGFAQEVDISALPHRTVLIKAWSIDLAREEIFPLEGAVRLEREAPLPWGLSEK